MSVGAGKNGCVDQHGRRSAVTPGAVLVVAGLLVACGVRATSAQTFEEVSAAAGIRHVCEDPFRVCGGAAFFDYDNDGWEDLYLTGGLRADRLFRNRGDGKFRDVTKEAGLSWLGRVTTVGVVTGDIDGDGFRDVFVTTDEHHSNILLRNQGDGTFADISETSGISRADKVWSTAASFGDYDLDGDLDLYVGNFSADSRAPYEEDVPLGMADVLYRNNGDGTFSPASNVIAPSEGAALAVAFTDLDGDFDPDLYVSNDFGFRFVPNQLYRNEFPDERFVDVTEATGTGAGINGMGIAVGDYDADGDLDLYLTNLRSNLLYENSGDGRFRDVAADKGVDDPYATNWGTAFLDFDNDGALDILVASGRVMMVYFLDNSDHRMRLIRPHANRLFRGRGGAAFEDVSETAGVADTTRGRGIAVGDYDRDGDLDFAVAVVVPESDEQAHALVYRNRSNPGNHWLQIRLQGASSNRDGYGSRIEVVSGEQLWVREIDGGSSYLSQHSSVAHVGLGGAARVDSVVVTWPGGRRQVAKEVPVDRRIRITEGAPGFREEKRPN